MTLKASLQKGLVFHMSLDQESYNPTTKRFTDKTPYSNHGTSYNDATFTTDHIGQPNRATNFNGTDDFIDCGNDESLNITDAITIEAWVKGASTQSVSFPKVVTKRFAYLNHITQTPPYTFVFNILSNSVIRQITISSALNVDEWAHFVSTYDGRYGKIYKNGSLIATKDFTTVGKIDTNTNDLTIGAYSGADTPFNGAIDEVRIYNRALSADEITSLYEQYRPKVMLNSLDRGLVLNMSLDQKSYNPATKRFSDKTPYSNHGTSYNDATFTTDRMGQASRAMPFNGTDDYVDCGNDESLNITDAITIEAWVKKNQNPTDYIHFVAKNNFDIHLRLQASGQIHWYIAIGGVYEPAPISSALNDDEWYHIVGTYDKDGGSDNQRLYINGELVNTVTKTGAIDDTAGTSLIIGKGGHGYFNGAIDEVRIYNRALSADEIATLYKMYRPKLLI